MLIEGEDELLAESPIMVRLADCLSKVRSLE